MNLQDIAIQEATRLGVDPSLVLRTMRQESGGNPNAVSPKGARGPMQLMPATARQLGVDPNDPADNIRGGVRYLKQQLDTFGDPRLALAAYNAGPGAVRRYGGIPPYAETQNYVGSIMGGQQEPASGADIFADVPDAGQAPSRGGFQTAQGGSGADIFIDDPAPQNPAASVAAPVAAAPKAIPPAQQRTSELLGLLKGGFKAVDNTANHAVDALQGTPVGNFLANNTPDMRKVLPTGVYNFIQNPQAFYDAQAAKGVKPGGVGDFAGQVLSTAWVPGGPLASGALQGTLLSEKKDIPGIMGDAAASALGGKIAGKAMDGLGAAMKGVADPAARYLAERGVQLTPGQIMGGFAQNLENKASSLPFVGTAIQQAQKKAKDSFTVAAVNESLQHLGMKLPEGVTGHSAMEYLQNATGDAYDAILPKLSAKVDKAFVEGQNAIYKSVPARVMSDFGKILQDHFQVAPDGSMTGQALKDAESGLGHEIAIYSKSGDPADVKVMFALQKVQQNLRDLIARQNPVAADALQAANAAYRKRVVVGSAASKTSDGTFTPSQLRTASRQADPSRRKAAVERGQGVLQELAKAGEQVMPTMPNSFTADRNMSLSIPANLTGLLARLGYGGAQLGAKAMSGPRSPFTQVTAQQMKRFARPAALLAGAGTAQSRN